MVEQPLDERRAVQSEERDALCPAPAFFLYFYRKKQASKDHAAAADP
jgi:hypothetical protein